MQEQNENGKSQSQTGKNDQNFIDQSQNQQTALNNNSNNHDQIQDSSQSKKDNHENNLNKDNQRNNEILNVNTFAFNQNQNQQQDQSLQQNQPEIIEKVEIQQSEIIKVDEIIKETIVTKTLVQEQNLDPGQRDNGNTNEIKEEKVSLNSQENNENKRDNLIDPNQESQNQKNSDQHQQESQIQQTQQLPTQSQNNKNNNVVDNFSHKAQHGSVCDRIPIQQQKKTIQEINKELNKEPHCRYSKVYCYGNCETDQFRVELTREGVTQQYYQTRRPFEIQKFDEMQKKIIKLVTGSMHSVVITEDGEVYTWGNNDSGQLGRKGESTTPLKVDLEEPVNLASAGESFTILANSESGNLYFFGKLKTPAKNLVKHEEPLAIRYGIFQKYKIQDIKCGQNHILILSNQRVYVWGDVSQGALGNQFRRDINRVDFEKPTCINKRGVIKIFTTDYSSFIVVKKGGKRKRQTIYAFGLNNFNQLGFESEDEKEGKECLPVKWTEIYGDEIIDIQGGEHHTFVLYKNGDLYGSGKNDEGQLGDVDNDAEPYGTFQKLSHLPFKVSKIVCSSHFTYALDEEQKNYCAWGFGYDYVLANGKEDSLFQARKVNNQKFFKLFPKLISLGTNFVSYVAGTLGNENFLQDKLKTKKKRVYRGPKLQSNKTRVTS